jgi:hypothetical protein
MTSEVDTREVERRLWLHVSPPELRGPDEQRLAEALNAIAQERAARERAEAEAERERTLRDWYEHKIKLIASQTTESQARKHARYALSTTPEPARQR